MAIAKPVSDRPYERNLDWYRVRYQLAALYLSRATAAADNHEQTASAQVKEALEMSRSLARLVAENIVRLDSRYKELLRFLRSTIEPSALLLLAGAQVLADRTASEGQTMAQSQPLPSVPLHEEMLKLLQGEGVPNPLLLVAFVERQLELAPRVLYNLACFYVRVGDLDVASSWLKRAVRQTPVAERPALLGVIAKEALLEPLRERGDFLDDRPGDQQSGGVD